MLVIYHTAQASVIEFDADFFAEGDHVAVIDCMTFVPEFPGRFHLTKRCCNILQCCDMLRRCTAVIPWKIWKPGGRHNTAEVYTSPEGFGDAEGQRFAL